MIRQRYQVVKHKDDLVLFVDFLKRDVYPFTSDSGLMAYFLSNPEEFREHMGTSPEGFDYYELDTVLDDGLPICVETAGDYVCVDCMREVIWNEWTGWECTSDCGHILYAIGVEDTELDIEQKKFWTNPKNHIKFDQIT